MKTLSKVLSCVGLVAFLGAPAWAGGGGGDDMFEDTVRSLNDRIKQLEDEVNRIKAAPPREREVIKQVPDNRVDGLAKRLRNLEDEFAPLKGLEIHGVLAVDYTYNFNRPRGDRNGLVLFNTDDNTGILEIANIQVSHKSLFAGVGFVVDADFGEVAEGVGGVTRWGDSFPNSSENDNFFELRQAYLTYTAPVGNGLSFKAGKFVTLLGAEVLPAWDNINHNITRSILFGYAIPFTHTGLLASYPINDFLAVDAGVVNGWDSVEDNNDGKTFLGGINITPHEMVSLYISGTYGAEQEDRGDSKRWMVASMLTVKPMNRLTFIIDYNYGSESDVCPRGGGNCLDPLLPNSALTKKAEWMGLGGYAIIDLTDRLTFALRGEWFMDDDGIRTGTGRRGMDFWEVTPTLSYTIAKGLVARVEYRHDEAQRDFHQTHCRNCFVPGQDLITSQLLYHF